MTKEKLSGRAFYESLGSPKKIVAPMVDHSELAWRRLSKKYGADLSYSPMLHARLFAENEKYRQQNLSEMDGDVEKDRPLIIQFCANDPQFLLAAAKLVEDKCDAVDLNLGCPQGIARRGHYGSFLQDEWDLVYKLINNLHKNLSIPVTAKIRVFESKEKTLKYAKMILSAGAQFLTVHGRTREMKGQQTGFADWEAIRYLRDNLPPETVIFANGNILYQEDIARCLEATGADAVMSAEANLYNPAIFNVPVNYSTSIPQLEDVDRLFPRLDRISREYVEFVKSSPGEISFTTCKSHLFKLFRPFLPIHTNVRDTLAKCGRGSTIEDYERLVEQVHEIIEDLLKIEENKKLDTVTRSDISLDETGAVYKQIPYWRAQPYFRKVSGKVLIGTGEKRALEEKFDESQAKKEKT
ncbi:dihydrouridine synthase-domain-containing protein, partial [Lipomyces japonicus]|uniref:dihydrouridine synthase-domain-containing protein n=1 Tax=Lipomyces japonicus TaxID=56871 RepID=UPI0034CF17EC